MSVAAYPAAQSPIIISCASLSPPLRKLRSKSRWGCKMEANRPEHGSLCYEKRRSRKTKSTKKYIDVPLQCCTDLQRLRLVANLVWLKRRKKKLKSKIIAPEADIRLQNLHPYVMHLNIRNCNTLPCRETTLTLNTLSEETVPNPLTVLCIEFKAFRMSPSATKTIASSPETS